MPLVPLTLFAVLQLQFACYQTSLVSMSTQATVQEELRQAMLEDAPFEATTQSQIPSKPHLGNDADATASLRGSSPESGEVSLTNLQLEGQKNNFGGCGPGGCESLEEEDVPAKSGMELAVERVQWGTAGSEILDASLRIVSANTGKSEDETAGASAASPSGWKLPFPTALGLRTLAILAASVTGLARLVMVVTSALQGPGLKPTNADKPY